MRLIDADTFKEQVAAAAISSKLPEAANKANIMISLIDMQPTVSYQPLEGYVYNGKQLYIRSGD